MSSSVAPLAFGIVGAVIGSFFGATAIGFALGTMLGGALFPSTTEGPKLDNLHLQGSSYGAAIPIVYGSVRTAGNVVWKTDLEPHEHTSGGKGGGGGGAQKTTSYSASFRIRICESRGDHRLGRVWVNGQLKGDYRAGATTAGELPLVFYDGSLGQGPDPTQEAIIGVGLVPAYRRVADTVLTDMDLSPYGNVAVPNLNFEILSGTVEDCPITSTYTGDCVPPPPDTQWHEGTSGGTGPYPAIEQWLDPTLAPDLVTKLPNTVWTHTSPGGGSVHWGFEYFTGPKYTVNVGGVTKVLPTWVTSGVLTSGNVYNPAFAWGTKMFVTLPGSGDVHQFNGTAGTRKAWVMAEGAIYPADRDDGGTTPLLSTVPIPALGLDIVGTCGIPAGLYVHFLVGTPDTKRLFVFTGAVPFSGLPQADHWYELINGLVSRSGTCDPPLNQDDFGTTNHTQPQYLSFACSMAENNGQYVWSYVSTGLMGGSLRCYKIDADNNLAQICTDKHLAASGGFAAPSIWTFANGLCGVLAFQSFEVFARYDLTATPTVTLADICADVCIRDGMDATQYDVSDIESIVVRGYILNSIPTTGRAALESILPAFFVDAVESDGKIKFVRRGKASLVSIPDADLAAHADGEALPDKLQIIRGQDEDLPAHIILNYINFDTDYLVGTQQWRRMTGGSKVVKTANLSLVLTDAEAKRIVETWGAIAWDERDQYFFYTTRKYIKYEPTDVMTVQGIDLRIINKLEGANGVIKWEGRRSRVGVFAQAGVAGAGGSTPGTITAAQATALLLLDIPYPDPTKLQPYYAAMNGADRPAWAGATLVKSINDGASYDALISDSGPADTFGVTDGVLGDWTDGFVFDERNRITVVLNAGASDVAGVGRTGALNGQGLWLIGEEMLFAKNAVLIDTRTYVLSGLLRGQFGTEQFTGTHVDGEQVVVLPVTTSIDALWAEYGLARKYQAITSGQSLPAGGGSSGGGGTGFAATHVIDLGAWGHKIAYTKDNGGFGPNDLVAWKFTTGSGPSPTNNMPRIASAEFPSTGGSVNRTFSLSDTLGNFDGLIDSALGTTYFAAKGESSAPTVPFTVNNAANQVYFPILKPNTTYYLNMKLAPNQPNITGDQGMYGELSVFDTP